MIVYFFTGMILGAIIMKVFITLKSPNVKAFDKSYLPDFVKDNPFWFGDGRK